jgi:FixJ family two-component response regulator
VGFDLISKTRIALIDDDDSMRRAVGRLLRVNGYACSTYASAEAALATAEFLEVNCAVVDIQLGGMSGFDISDRLDALGVSMPRIFITAHVDLDLPKRRGNRLLLIKPFEESELIASIESSIVG